MKTIQRQFIDAVVADYLDKAGSVEKEWKDANETSPPFQPELVEFAALTMFLFSTIDVLAKYQDAAPEVVTCLDRMFQDEDMLKKLIPLIKS